MNIILTLSFRIMRHNLLHLLTLALALMSGGEMAWGETVTYRMTIDSQASGGNNDVHWLSSSTTSLTWEGITWKVGFTKKDNNTGVSQHANYAQIGSTDHPAKKITMSTTGFAGKTIKSVSMSAYCMSNAGPTLTITAGSQTILNNKKLTKQLSGTIGDDIATYVSQNNESITLNENEAITFTISSSVSSGINIYAVSVEFEAATTTPTFATVNLNASGYATFASTKPLDFTSTEGVTAWKVNEVDGTSLGFEQITGAVKAGTGLLLMGNASTSVEIPYAESGDELSDNKLVGITEDTEISAGTYYGLKGTSFVPVNAGTIPAGKALLPAEAVPSSVKAFTFVFDDVDGIRTVKTVTPDEAQAIFNLSGQRLPKTQRGLNIINGKKVIMK